MIDQPNLFDPPAEPDPELTEVEIVATVLDPTDDPDCSMVRPPADRHRLAPIATGDRGIPGNHGADLMRQARSLLNRAWNLQVPTDPWRGGPDDPAWLAARELDRHRSQEAFRLVDLAQDLMSRSTSMSIFERRAERLAGINERRLDKERRRAEGGLYAAERRSPNIATHVEVADEAWKALKADVASRRWATVGETVGQLVIVVADGHSGGESAIVTTSAVSGESPAGRRASRFVRLLGVDQEQWRRFRAAAVDADVSTARLVGLVIERGSSGPGRE